MSGPVATMRDLCLTICARFRHENHAGKRVILTLLVLSVMPLVGNAQKHPSRLYMEGHLGMKLIYGAGVGYTILPGHDLSVRVLAGPDKRDGVDADITSGSVQWRGTLLPSVSVTPFLELGYGLSSLFVAPYYNGHSCCTSAGVRWWFTTHFDISLRAVFARTWYHQRGSPVNAQPSFTDNRVWGMLSVGFAPGL